MKTVHCSTYIWKREINQTTSSNVFLKKLYSTFLWMGFNRLNATEPLREDSLLITIKSPEGPGTQLIDLGRTKGWDDLGVTLWFLTWGPWFGNPNALTTRPWLLCFLLYELYRRSQGPTNIKPSVIRQKGDNQNGCFKKTNHAKFSEKRTFLIPWYAHVCTCADQGVRNVRFSENLLCFVFLIISLLPYYWRNTQLPFWILSSWKHLNYDSKLLKKVKSLERSWEILL